MHESVSNLPPAAVESLTSVSELLMVEVINHQYPYP